MKYLIVIVSLFNFQSLSAQTATQVPVDQRNSSLAERYQTMKSKSETYQDYKVIKESILDGEWKIVMDSIRANKALLRDASHTNSALTAELHTTQEGLHQKESSQAEIIYASTHISVFGINFEKRMFNILVLIILLGLVLLLGIMIGRLKLMHVSVKEKIDLVNATINELEEYKRKALDRQTKLSRELQTERNKLTELRRG